MFMSSLWDKDAIEKLDPYLKVHKVGSGDLTNYPILDLLAKKDKPLIISTAMSTLDDVRGAVDYVRKVNPELVSRGDLVLLHCVAMYGDAREEYANLLAIKKLQNEFPGIHIGYSDHTKGVYACELSIAMGARVIEKHFTDDIYRDGPDHKFSMDIQSWKEMIERTRELEAALGTEEKTVMQNEQETVILQRRSVRTNRFIAKGEIVHYDDLSVLRPCPQDAIPPYRIDEVLGKVINRNIDEGDYIRIDDLK